MDRLLRTTFSAIGLSLVLSSPVLAAGDPAKGQALFVRCQVCHTAQAGAPNRVGPNLFRVVGRKAGTLPNYFYSPAMKRVALTWDQQTLTRYLMSPSSAVPGTKMTFAGFSDQQQASDVAAYLATLK